MRDAEECVMLELKGGFSYKAANFLSRWFYILKKDSELWGRTVMWLFLDAVLAVKFLDVSDREGTALQVH
jgi:hypothetical protein